jgi:hypothetical protein
MQHHLVWYMIIRDPRNSVWIDFSKCVYPKSFNFHIKKQINQLAGNLSCNGNAMQEYREIYTIKTRLDTTINMQIQIATSKILQWFLKAI